MRITKDEIAELLEENGDPGTAHRARATLPDEVDTVRDDGLLATLGVDVDELLDQV